MNQYAIVDYLIRKTDRSDTWYEAGYPINCPLVGQGKPAYDDLRWAFPLKYSFLVSCLYPHGLSLSGLARRFLRNAQVCKGLKRTDNWLKREFAVQSYADELD